MSQAEVPVVQALLRHLARGKERFHVPGHKGGRGAYAELTQLLGPDAVRLDLTEVEGLDDLHWPVPDGPLARAQHLAAEVFGGREARFLVGGATAGVLAMVLASVGPGETLLAPLPFHRSAAAAAVLAGCRLETLPPRVAATGGVALPVTSDTLANAVERVGPAAVLATSPTYHGVAADLAGWARVCAGAGVPLLVDSAHGAHFGVAPAFPPGAMQAGASAAVVSLHKTAGALTAGAVLLLGRPGRGLPPAIDPARADAALRFVQTSSPSFPVLASLDLARRRLALAGREDWSRAAELCRRTASRIRALGHGWLEELDLPRDLAGDPTRLVFVLAGQAPPALTGVSLAVALAREGVDLELAGWGDVILVATPADTERQYDRLVSAFGAALSQGQANGGWTASAQAGAPGQAAADEKTSGPAKRELALAMEKDCWEANRTYAVSPSEAFRRPHRWVPVTEAVGRTAADVLCPYPPGVPLVVPGQRLEERTVRYLAFLVRQGRRVHGLADTVTARGLSGGEAAVRTRGRAARSDDPVLRVVV